MVVFDYQGKGHSEGKYSDRNCYFTLKGIIKNLSSIIDEPFNMRKLVLCGEGYGVSLIRKYIKRHKYYKCIFINPPDDYLRSYNKKKRNKIRVLTTSTKNIAYNDKKYFKEINNDDDLLREMNEFLGASIELMNW
jgi:hypothetical protein